MRNVLATIGVIVLLLLLSLAAWIWRTIPPAPEPDALPSTVTDPPSSDYRDAIERGQPLARSLLAEEKLPGLSLAVAVDGQIVWAEGFRWSDMEQETAMTPSTRLRIGGISQALTAAAVGLLVERGRLDLDAPVQRYLPDYPEESWPVTTRLLMAHMAGIRPYRGEGGIFRGANCADDTARLTGIAGKSLHYRPGSEIQYSTLGWSLVGAVIAASAEEPYLEFMQREIFGTLQLERTTADLPDQTEPGSAHFYYPRLMLDPRYGLQDAPVVDLSCHLPAVGFLSTPSDLVRFGSAMMDGGLLDPSTVEELQTPMQLESGESTEQALGWTVRIVALGADSSPTRIVGQGLGAPVQRQPLSAQTADGAVAGCTASLLLVPERRLAIAVASNVSGAENVPLLAQRLADLFVQDLQTR